MPFINDISDEEKQQAQGGTQQISAGAQVFGASTQNPNAQTATANADKGSGQFADLSNYLRINQPQNFGTQLAGKVGSDIQNEGNAIDQTGQEFKSRADQATVQANPDLVARATGDQAADFAADKANVDAFQKQMKASYAGPTSFSDASDLFNTATGAAQTATQKADAGQSESGRFALLNDYFGNPTYTQGQKSLDNLLVQNDPNAQQAFDQMKQNAQGVADKEKTVESSSNAYGSAARGTTEATSNAARAALGVDASGNVLTDASGNPLNQGAIGTLENTLQNSATSAQAAYDKATQDIQAAVASKDLSKLTPEEKQMLGLELPQDLYKVDPSNYLSFTPKTDINVSTEASKADAARLDALLKLGGLQNSFLDDSVAGTAPTSFAKFDQTGFNNAIGDQQAQYTGQANPILSNIQSLATSPLVLTDSGNPLQDRLNQISDQYNKLNAVRAQYGLAPLSNPYTTSLAPGATATPAPTGVEQNPTSGGPRVL